MNEVLADSIKYRYDKFDQTAITLSSFRNSEAAVASLFYTLST